MSQAQPTAGDVIAVTGAGGPAGRATVARLAATGATVLAVDNDQQRLDETVASVTDGDVRGYQVDLLDLDSTRAWADKVRSEHGRLDGVAHLVGGWRGGKSFADVDLADWTLLEKLLVTTLQHVSLATYELLAESDHGRFLIVSAAGASKPTAGNACYATAKAASEAWTLALADQFKKLGGDDGPAAAAVILVIKALLTDQMRAAKPEAKFAGFTHVDDLATTISGLWGQDTAELNGTHQWLTDRP